jgi:hypothetical protein
MTSAKFQKKPVAELLADAIEVQIRREGWKGLLPSGRDLAEHHKVSLPTVQKALSLLITRKVLTSRGVKRRVEVAPEVSGLPRSGGQSEILILSTKPLAGFDGSVSLGIQKLGETLKAEGHGFNFVDLGLHQGADLRKAAHAEMVKFKPTHCILMAPDADLFAGVSRHRVKIASIFGNLRSKKVFRLGIRYGYFVEIAVKKLVALGHRRFFMPFLGRKFKLCHSLTAIARVAQEQGVVIDVRYTAQELTAENMGVCLDTALAKGATAVLFPQWTDFMPAIGYFARRRLEFPRDVSVVSLIGTALSPLFSPPIACCLLQPEGLLQQAKLWIRSETMDLASFDAAFTLTWQWGGSIGPVPRKG